MAAAGQKTFTCLAKNWHHFMFEGEARMQIHVLRDSRGSNLGSVFLKSGGLWAPDSSSAIDKSSPRDLSNLWRKLSLSSGKGLGAFAVSFKLCTCWRQTWTASWTLTKYHSFPIRSTTPDLDKVSRTSWFGLEMAICKTNPMIHTFFLK